jgi:hypothetical protein
MVYKVYKLYKLCKLEVVINYSFFDVVLDGVSGQGHALFPLP